MLAIIALYKMDKVTPPRRFNARMSRGEDGDTRATYWPMTSVMLVASRMRSSVSSVMCANDRRLVLGGFDAWSPSTDGAIGSRGPDASPRNASMFDRSAACNGMPGLRLSSPRPTRRKSQDIAQSTACRTSCLTSGLPRTRHPWLRCVPPSMLSAPPPVEEPQNACVEAAKRDAIEAVAVAATPLIGLRRRRRCLACADCCMLPKLHPFTC